MHGSLLHLMATNEPDRVIRLAKRPCPHTYVVRGRRQYLDHAIGLRATPRDELAVLGRPRRLCLLDLSRIRSACLDTRSPEPVDLAEVPDEVCDVPARATRYGERQVGSVGGRIEQIALTTDGVKKFHPRRCTRIGSGSEFHPNAREPQRSCLRPQARRWTQ